MHPRAIPPLGLCYVGIVGMWCGLVMALLLIPPQSPIHLHVLRKGFEQGTVERTHGSLLAIRQLLRHPGPWMGHRHLRRRRRSNVDDVPPHGAPVNTLSTSEPGTSATASASATNSRSSTFMPPSSAVSRGSHEAGISSKVFATQPAPPSGTSSLGVCVCWGGRSQIVEL